jgi:hypothetical protein
MALTLIGTGQQLPVHTIFTAGKVTGTILMFFSGLQIWGAH